MERFFDFSENEPDFSPDDVIRDGISEVAVVTEGGTGVAFGVFEARFESFDGFVFIGRAVVALSHEGHFGIDVGAR